jgi:hypothetical protein
MVTLARITKGAWSMYVERIPVAMCCQFDPWMKGVGELEAAELKHIFEEMDLKEPDRSIYLT